MSEAAPWQEVFNRAMQLPDGPGRLALVEEAVRIADAHAHDLAGFELRRKHLMWSAILSGQPQKMLTAFTWCLAQSDRDPQKFDPDELLWHYCNWVPVALHLSPLIPKAQIDSVFEDLFDRLRRAGWNLRPAWEQRALAYAFLGDLERAADFWAHRCKLPRDKAREGSKGARGHEVTYHLNRGDEAAAVEAAEPFISGRVTPGSNAQFAHLLMPLVRAGRVEEAMRCHLREYHRLAGTVLYLGEIGKHMEFLALTDNLDAAVVLLERHAAWRWRTHEYVDRFNFQVSARFVVERLRASGRERARLRLPKEMPVHRPDGDYDLTELAGWYDGESREIAALYDARAGNDFFSRTNLDAERELHTLVTPHPLPAPPPAGWKKNSK